MSRASRPLPPRPRLWWGIEGETTFGYAQAVLVGDVVSVAGQVARTPRGQRPVSVRRQLRESLGRIGVLASRLGGSFESGSALRIHVPAATPMTLVANEVGAAMRGRRFVASLEPVASLASADYALEISAVVGGSVRDSRRRGRGQELDGQDPHLRSMGARPSVTIGEIVHVSGLMPLAFDGSLPESDPAAQMSIVLTRLDAVLTAAGSDLSCVFSTTVHVTADVSDQALVNVMDAHRRAFAGAAPVSTLLTCPVLPWPGAHVQLSAQASRSAA